MKTVASTSTISNTSVHTEQPPSGPKLEDKDLSINFFVIGGVINIVMIAAYFIWAIGAWKKTVKRKGR